MRYLRDNPTLVGLYKDIISVSLAVAIGVFIMPFGFWLKPSPLEPMGESIAMGIEDMVTACDIVFKAFIMYKRALSNCLIRFELCESLDVNYVS
jgi:hypothetical protein